MNKLLLDETDQDLEFEKDFLAAEEEPPSQGRESWSLLEERYGREFYGRALYLLTRKVFDPEEARSHWQGTLDRREELSAGLGREVGLRVALADYLVNTEQRLDQPLLIESRTYWEKERSALSDELTGLFNRRFFNEILEKQVAVAHRYGQTFSLLMADVDHFKVYNDRYGHLAGDRALMDIARLLKAHARAIDYLTRYGGEEFAIILPHTTRTQAVGAADRYRRAVEAHCFLGQKELPGGNLTISLGVANVPGDAQQALELVNRSDQALYEAKRAGRNRVSVSGPERRRHRRVDYSARVEYRYLGSGGDYLQGMSLDVSQSGIRISSPTRIPEGRALDLVLHPPDWNTSLRLEGTAVRICAEPPAEKPFRLAVCLEPRRDQPLFRELVENKLLQVD